MPNHDRFRCHFARMAISKSLEAINQVHMAENFKLFSKAF